jgi:hypothetical protein
MVVIILIVVVDDATLIVVAGHLPIRRGHRGCKSSHDGYRFQRLSELSAYSIELFRPSLFPASQIR